MAENIMDAFVNIFAKDTGLNKTLEDMKSGFMGVGKVASAIGVGAAAAVSGIGAAAIKIAIDFENSTKKIQSQLGLTADEASAMGDIVKEVWGNNFGDSVEDVSEQLVKVKQNLGDLVTDDELGTITEKAISLRDAFGDDIDKTINASKSLIQEFGISSSEAFDFITAGYQRGLNSSGDFLDSITEYSNQFAFGGANAGEFFSLMETGMAGGVLGTDKAADSFKEFGIRIIDGSKTTKEGLDLIGLSQSDLETQINNGTLTISEAYQLVNNKLKETEDQTIRNQAGVALYGTQFEDMTENVALNIDLTKTKLSELGGSSDSLNAQYETLGSAFEGMQRQALLALEPLGQEMLTIINDNMPRIEAAFQQVIALAPQFGELFKSALDFVLETLVPLIDSTLSWTAANKDLVLSVGGFLAVAGPLSIILAPIVSAIISMVSALSGGAGLVGLLSSLAPIIAVVATAWGAWSFGSWLADFEVVKTSVQFLIGLLPGLSDVVTETAKKSEESLKKQSEDFSVYAEQRKQAQDQMLAGDTAAAERSINAARQSRLASLEERAKQISDELIDYDKRVKEQGIFFGKVSVEETKEAERKRKTLDTTITAIKMLEEESYNDRLKEQIEFQNKSIEQDKELAAIKESLTKETFQKVEQVEKISFEEREARRKQDYLDTVAHYDEVKVKQDDNLNKTIAYHAAITGNENAKIETVSDLLKLEEDTRKNYYDKAKALRDTAQTQQQNYWQTLEAYIKDYNKSLAEQYQKQVAIQQEAEKEKELVFRQAVSTTNTYTNRTIDAYKLFAAAQEFTMVDEINGKVMIPFMFKQEELLKAWSELTKEEQRKIINSYADVAGGVSVSMEAIQDIFDDAITHSWYKDGLLDMAAITERSFGIINRSFTENDIEGAMDKMHSTIEQRKNLFGEIENVVTPKEDVREIVSEIEGRGLKEWRSYETAIKSQLEQTMKDRKEFERRLKQALNKERWERTAEDNELINTQNEHRGSYDNRENVLRGELKKVDAAINEFSNNIGEIVPYDKIIDNTERTFGDIETIADSSIENVADTIDGLGNRAANSFLGITRTAMDSLELINNDVLRRLLDVASVEAFLTKRDDLSGVIGNLSQRIADQSARVNSISNTSTVNNVSVSTNRDAEIAREVSRQLSEMQFKSQLAAGY